MAGQVKIGDLVKCDDWVYNGIVGMIISVQQVKHCAGAYVLLDAGVKLIRLDNLRLVNEGR